MNVRYSLVIMVLALILTTSTGLAQGKGYSFELKSFTSQIPSEVWRLYSATPKTSSVELGGLAVASSFILWDEPLYNAFHQTSLSNFSGWDTISLFGEPALYGLTGITLALNNNPMGEDLMYAVGMASANTLFLKFTVGMARPYLDEGVKFIGPTLQSDYAAFPSGHAASAFSAATVFSHYYPDYAPWFWVGASLVGLSRIYEEKHWPSNLLFGAILGYISARHTLKIRNPIDVDPVVPGNISENEVGNIETLSTL